MKRNSNIQYRQGDVLIERVARIPDPVTRQKTSKRIILAHGEVTGHHHSFDGAAVEEFKGEDGSQFFHVCGRKISMRLPVERAWRGQVLVKHPRYGLIEFSSGDVVVSSGMAHIDGNFALLEHQEHRAHGVPAGFYRGGSGGKKVRQREYSPEAIRTVAD